MWVPHICVRREALRSTSSRTRPRAMLYLAEDEDVSRWVTPLLLLIFRQRHHVPVNTSTSDFRSGQNRIGGLIRVYQDVRMDLIGGTGSREDETQRK